MIGNVGWAESELSVPSEEPPNGSTNTSPLVVSEFVFARQNRVAKNPLAVSALAHHSTILEM